MMVWAILRSLQQCGLEFFHRSQKSTTLNFCFTVERRKTNLFSPPFAMRHDKSSRSQPLRLPLLSQALLLPALSTECKEEGIAFAVRWLKLWRWNAGTEEDPCVESERFRLFVLS
ncbi:expressed unknown protein [Seminavis robusta]|uniref:Uncharacterized protein n=1 Tax=Seminavis robusta TaxID=568900 RepID=A0A9N8F1A3_9STRA|nr:expressed unknown protein [Seminavis robusta]|eukprot:Sro3063_g343012.1  (115) ;mRNA; r:4770-5114